MLVCTFPDNFFDVHAAIYFTEETKVQSSPVCFETVHMRTPTTITCQWYHVVCLCHLVCGSNSSSTKSVFHRLAAATSRVTTIIVSGETEREREQTYMYTHTTVYCMLKHNNLQHQTPTYYLRKFLTLQGYSENDANVK